MTGLSHPRHHVRVTLEMKSDIIMWLTFLEKFNGTYYFDESDWVTSTQLQLFTDSAGNASLGCAAIFKTHWVFFKWPQKWENDPLMRDISFLE